MSHRMNIRFTVRSFHVFAFFLAILCLAPFAQSAPCDGTSDLVITAATISGYQQCTTLAYPLVSFESAMSQAALQLPLLSVVNGSLSIGVRKSVLFVY